jgi:hypothetical protein
MQRVSRRSMNQISEPWAPVFPSRTTRKLRYSTNFSLTSTAGVVASYVFVANGLFDPDYTSTGHQPMGFDQLMLSYNHYCVLSSRILVTFRNIAAQPMTASITVQANGTPITVIDQIVESGINNMTVLEQKGVAGMVTTLEAKYNTRRFVGVDDPLDDPNLTGAVASNPAESEYFHIQIWDTNGGSGTVHADAILEFTATFTEPRVLTESLRLALKRMVLNEVKTAHPSTG